MVPFVQLVFVPSFLLSLNLMLFVLLFLVCGFTLNGISGGYIAAVIAKESTAGGDEQVVVEAVVGKYSMLGRMWERIPERILEGVEGCRG